MSPSITSASAVFTDGPCPFLTCLETGPHGHDICPHCGAVKSGNAFCGTCRSRWPGGDPLAEGPAVCGCLCHNAGQFGSCGCC